MYVRSLHDTSHNRGNAYRLQYDSDNLDVLSQPFSQDDDYHLDSFCVPNDEPLRKGKKIKNISDGNSKILKRSSNKVEDVFDEPVIKRKKTRIKIAPDSALSPEDDVIVRKPKLSPLNNRKMKLDELKDFPSEWKQKHPIVCEVSPKRTVTTSCNLTPNISSYKTGGKQLRIVEKPSSSSLATSSDIISSTKTNLILVGHNQITYCQRLISALRASKDVYITCKPLVGADFIVSNRVGVLRRTYLDLLSIKHKDKHLQNIRLLCQIFDRACLLIEKDVVKDDKHGARKERSEYMDNMLSHLTQLHVRLLYSSSQENSSQILQKLCIAETVSGNGIKVPIEFTSKKENMLKAIVSIPDLNYVIAMNLIAKFPTLSALFNASVALLKENGCMSSARALSLYKYFRHKVSNEMLP